MSKMVSETISNRLPVRQNLAYAYGVTLLVAGLLAFASILGLRSPASVYPTEELQQSFMANDVANLLIGLPILLGSLWVTRRGRLVGLLFWPGALFYILYNSIAYLAGLPFNLAYLLHLTLVTASIYTIASLVAGMDGEAVRERLAGKVPERAAGGILMVMGAGFFLRVLAISIPALINRTPVPGPEIPAMISDFITSPAWVIGGVLLWRRQTLGYVAGLGLLFQGSMLFISLIIFLIMQPIITAAAFAPGDVLAVTVMGLIFFVPFGLFVRGVVSGRRPARV